MSKVFASFSASQIGLNGKNSGLWSAIIRISFALEGNKNSGPKVSDREFSALKRMEYLFGDETLLYTV